MNKFLLGLCILLCSVISVAAAELTQKDKSGALVVSYDIKIGQSDVLSSVKNIVKADAQAKNKRIIYIISGTHGAKDGTVSPQDADINFKYEDLDSAKVTRNNINVRNYHETAPNRWKELSDKGPNSVIILAWCFSNQWTKNNSVAGYNGKIVMK